MRKDNSNLSHVTYFCKDHIVQINLELPLKHAQKQHHSLIYFKLIPSKNKPKRQCV